MCGLLAYLADPLADHSTDLVNAVSDATHPMRHRGPDESGAWADDSDPADGHHTVVFGFNRLSIIDIAHSHQPLRWGPPDSPDRLLGAVLPQGTPVELLPIATRQLVAIARAIATKARMVIMDEPTTALTQREVDNLIRVINGLRASGVAVLFVSHKLDECYAIGGQVIILRDGEKVAQGPIADYTKSQLMQLMTGKHLDGRRYRTGAATGEVVLQAKHLGASGAFENVSFELRRGEILGLTGLLDSGRNELALALAGVSPADQGELLIDNAAQHFKTPADAIAKGIGYVPEDRLSEGLFLDKPIRDNVVTAVLNRLLGRFGMLDASKGDGLAEHTIKDLQIAAPNIMLPVQSLSGGNQQRVLIGRWLAIEPRVLVLHGPTVGVDVGSKDTIYRIVQRLAENGLAVLIISDDLPELLQNCDRILLMRKGHLAGEYAAANLEEAALYRALVGEESQEVAA